jgi:hypothetical protein
LTLIIWLFTKIPLNLPSLGHTHTPTHRLSCLHAGIAQLVEHDLAKVGVAGSSPVSRSKVKWKDPAGGIFFSPLTPTHRLSCPDGGIGRHAGLKIQWPVMAVWVQVPLRVLKKSDRVRSFFSHSHFLSCGYGSAVIRSEVLTFHCLYAALS